ncbi:MAG: hypothetical protein Q9219_006861 [cf. Caloplaca sp. 3 TL-2023]
MAPPPATTTTSITNLETDLNTKRNNAFLTLTRIAHIHPTLASALASVYRAALTCNAYVRDQAEKEGVDKRVLYMLYCGGAFTALWAAEAGMGFGARVLGMLKYFALVPVSVGGVQILLEGRGEGATAVAHGEGGRDEGGDGVDGTRREGRRKVKREQGRVEERWH